MKKIILVQIVILGIIGLIAGCAEIKTTTKIAFASYRDGNFEIYTMNSDGSNPTRITNNTAFDDQPSWSPDGTKIAFRSGRDDKDEIYVMNADGSNQTRLTDDTVMDWAPKWSPDGTKIAFEALNGENSEIYIMNADGSSKTRLTHNKTWRDSSPDWSPH